MFYTKCIRKLEEKVEQLETQSAIYVWNKGKDNYEKIVLGGDILQGILKHLGLEMVLKETPKLSFILKNTKPKEKSNDINARRSD